MASATVGSVLSSRAKKPPARPCLPAAYGHADAFIDGIVTLGALPRFA